MLKIDGHTGESIWSMISLDETHLAVGYGSNNGQLGKVIRLLNSNTGDLVRRLVGHTADVYTLEKLPDQKQLMASGSLDTTIKIWNWQSGDVIQNLTFHTGTVTGLILLASGLMASCSFDRSIKIWNSSSGIVMKTLVSNSGQWNMILIKDGLLASSSLDDEDIHIWNLKQEKITLRILSGRKCVSIIALAKINDTHIASGSRNDSHIKLWNVNLGSVVKSLLGHNSRVNSLVLLSNGHLASASSDKSIRIWNLKCAERGEDLVLTLFHPQSLKYPIIYLSRLLNGNLASGDQRGAICLWNFEQNSTNYSSITTSKNNEHL
jgi:WD40 repeat protein